MESASGTLTMVPVTPPGGCNLAKIDLVRHRKHDRDFRPQFRAPTQRELEGNRSDRHDSAYRNILILVLEMPQQTCLIALPAEAVEIEAFGVERYVRLAVGVHYRTQS